MKTNEEGKAFLKPKMKDMWEAWQLFLWVSKENQVGRQGAPEAQDEGYVKGMALVSVRNFFCGRQNIVISGFSFSQKRGEAPAAFGHVTAVA